MELRKEFGFNDIAYRDEALNIDMLLDGAVRYSVFVDDGADTDGVEEEFSEALTLAFSAYGENGSPYDSMARDEAFTDIMNSLLKEKWVVRGLALKEVFFTALYPDESSIKRLIVAKKNAGVSLPDALTSEHQKAACPYCGAVFAKYSDMKFCTECGAKLPESKAKNPVEDYILANFSYVDKVGAVKYYKAATGAGAEEAREAVTRLLEKDKSELSFLEIVNSVDSTPSERLESLARGLGLNDSLKGGLKNFGSFLDGLVNKGGIK